MQVDTLTLSQFTGLTENYAASDGSSLDTGDLRRKFNFGPYVSSLNIAQDPFFRFVSTIRKQPVDDPQFKFAEERPSFHKRYGYVVGHGTDGASYETANATISAAAVEQGDTFYVRVKTDYKSAGNITSRFGNVTNAVAIGATGTKPEFYLEGLLVKINTGTAFNKPADYIIGKIEQVTNAGSEAVDLKLHIIRTLKSSANIELQWLSATAPMVNTYNVANSSIKDNLESKKITVVGNAFGKGTGYPETWQDNPYSTGMGYTQIWKTALGMDNTTRATVLKYKGNEFMRIWGQKLIEHKWDIETDLLFGTQYIDGEGVQYTQGAVDYALQYGQTFTLNHADDTADDFLNDMSQYLDPRLNNSAATVFMCDTFTFNWLNKLSGYFNNNVQISPNYRADFAFKGTSNKLGVAVNKISTIYGDMNIVRNVHLDGTGISIVGVNMNYCRYRPLVGNGMNRDTSVYVGVQTLETTGVDKRVDLIMTEAGMEFMMPESFIIYTATY